jgi:DNA-binding NtrC family response regulator
VTRETIKVLLIDDDEDDYILTRELLTEVKIGKYALDWAASYEDGLKIAGRREHHVCLVDYRLGERTGVQLIREARESRLTTPMILLTGQGDHDVDVEAMEAGATDYLVKMRRPGASGKNNQIRGSTQYRALPCGRRTRSLRAKASRSCGNRPHGVDRR